MLHFARYRKKHITATFCGTNPQEVIVCETKVTKHRGSRASHTLYTLALDVDYW